MREKMLGQAGLMFDVVKRFCFCTLWLAAAQVLSCLVCFWVVQLLFSRDYQLEWMVYALGMALPVLWGVGGHCLPAKFQIKGRWLTAFFLLLWTALPAVLCVWADLGGPDILWLTLYPQLMARLAWFRPLFEGAQHAYVLNNLQPLAAAGTHVLMMAGFAVGLWAKKRQKKKSDGSSSQK